MAISDIEPTYLCIKEHRITGLKYLCKTTRSYKKMLKYTGSGKPYWNNHKKIHGNQIDTPWYCLFYNQEELTKFALMCSEQWDIVNAKDENGKKTWANLILENGLDGAPKGRPNAWSKGKPAWNRGIPLSEERKTAHSAKVKGKKYGPQTAEHKANYIAAKKHNGTGGNGGANKGKSYPEWETHICPHCNKVGSGNSMKRWHFDNCRMLQENKNDK